MQPLGPVGGCSRWLGGVYLAISLLDSFCHWRAALFAYFRPLPIVRAYFIRSGKWNIVGEVSPYALVLLERVIKVKWLQPQISPSSLKAPPTRHVHERHDCAVGLWNPREHGLPPSLAIFMDHDERVVGHTPPAPGAPTFWAAPCITCGPGGGSAPVPFGAVANAARSGT